LDREAYTESKAQFIESVLHAPDDDHSLDSTP
jgi:hypothetical protein